MSLLPVEFLIRGDDRWISAGWYAMPQVPAVGERFVLHGAESPAWVVDVLWEFGEVPQAAVTMREARLATLYGDQRMLARVRLSVPTDDLADAIAEADRQMRGVGLNPPAPPHLRNR